MFITRASRHDKPDVAEFLEAQGWTGADLGKGSVFFARDGAIVGCLRLVEMEPGTVVVEDVVVAEGRRGEGIGRSLVQAAMNSRGGTLYLRCHREVVPFFERLGFAQVARDGMPGSVLDHLGDVAPERPHVFMKAR